MSDVDPRIDKLESRYGHLDDQLSKQGAAISGINATLSQFGQTLKDISDKVHQPASSTNWWALISAMVAVVIVFGQGVTMLVAPIEKQAETLAEAMTSLSEARIQQAIDIARIDSESADAFEEIAEINARNLRTEVDVIDLQKRASAAEVSRKAAGDYLKEHANKPHE